MDGREFLNFAREAVRGMTEAHWRSAAGRAYYALMLEVREALARRGYPRPPRGAVHFFVRSRLLTPTDKDLNQIGRMLGDINNLRNVADYDLAPSPVFASDTATQLAIKDATDALDLLDAIDADPTRRVAAIAAVKKAFP